MTGGGPGGRRRTGPETERCDACLQRYALELRYRCIACDAPVCPFCIRLVRETREAFCVGCVPEGTRRSPAVERA